MRDKPDTGVLGVEADLAADPLRPGHGQAPPEPTGGPVRFVDHPRIAANTGG